jgi:predicted nucleic acid-binding protein
VIIPLDVRIKVVDRGKEEGAADAFLIESEIRDGWIVIEEITANDSVKEIARRAGIEIGESSAIVLARRKKCPILLDDLAARRFATGLGLEVAGSIGVLIRSAKNRRLSKSGALDALDKLARVMWTSWHG